MKSKQSFFLCLTVVILAVFSLPGSPVGAAEIAGASRPLAVVEATGRAVLPPGAFIKLSPADKATGVGINPLLDWGASANATGYGYCIDIVTGNKCASPSSVISTGTAHQVQLNGLDYSTTYKWQAVAINGSGTTFANGSPTAFWTFTTQAPPPPPGPFNKLSPTNGATGVGIFMLLDWEASANATGYAYCIDTTINNNCTPFISTGSAHQKSLELNYSTTYEWQVVATNLGGQTFANDSPTAFWTFTTQGPPPGAFNKVNPPDDLTGVVTNPILEWQTSTGATEYRYCVDGVISGTCNSSWVSTGTNNQVQLSGLTPNTTYEWQVEAYNATGSTYANGSAAASWTFTTMDPIPGPFTKLSPGNGASGVPTAVTLDWSESSEAEYYQICIDTSINNACNSNDGWVGVGAGHQVQISGLSPSTQYEWQVVATSQTETNTYADGGLAAFWSFTTAALAPPGAFNKLTPGNGATGVATSPVLDWGASSGATEYLYCYDTVINNTCNGSWVSSGAAHQAQLNGLSNATLYEWQVRAVNGGGSSYANGSSTAYWSFTTGTSLLNTYLPLLFR